MQNRTVTIKKKVIKIWSQICFVNSKFDIDSVKKHWNNFLIAPIMKDLVYVYELRNLNFVFKIRKSKCSFNFWIKEIQNLCALSGCALQWSWYWLIIKQSCWEISLSRQNACFEVWTIFFETVLPKIFNYIF